MTNPFFLADEDMPAPPSQTPIDEIFKKFGFWVWLSKGEVPENMMPDDAMSLKTTKTAIYNLLAEAAETWTRGYPPPHRVEVIELDKIKEIFGE